MLPKLTSFLSYKVKMVKTRFVKKLPLKKRFLTKLISRECLKTVKITNENFVFKLS